MNVQDVLNEASRRVPDRAPNGTRHRAEASVFTMQGAHRIAVDVRIDMQGRRREQCFYDRARVQRQELLRLTCAESECPQARALRTQWQSFIRRRRGLPELRRADNCAIAEPLMRETNVSVAGYRCVARPAKFRCFTSCPNAAHPPMWIDKSGYDLFEFGVCIGGGLTAPEATSRPRFPDLGAVEAHLLARSLEGAAVVGAIAERR